MRCGLSSHGRSGNCVVRGPQVGQLRRLGGLRGQTVSRPVTQSAPPASTEPSSMPRGVYGAVLPPDAPAR